MKTPRRAFVERPSGSGLGGLAPLPEPTATTHVDPATAARASVAANVVAVQADRTAKRAAIGGGILFSIGASMLLSAETEGVQKAGGVLTGLGLAGGLLAVHQTFLERQALSLRDRYAHGLIASGHAVPAEAGFQTVATDGTEEP